MAEFSTELIVGGFVAMGAAIAGIATAMAKIWAHFTKLVDNMRADFREQIGKMQHTLGKQDDEIREMRRFERDRLSKLASDSQDLTRESRELNRKLLDYLRRMDPANNRPTEALERKP